MLVALLMPFAHLVWGLCNNEKLSTSNIPVMLKRLGNISSICACPYQLRRKTLSLQDEDIRRGRRRCPCFSREIPIRSTP